MKFSEAILDATKTVLRQEEKSIVFGLGVTDPKSIFGTTTGLVKEFGPDRIFDMPLSENAMTGVGIGLALQNYKVLFIHQRLDFFLLAMDQLVNNAAKWHMMFGGVNAVPITIRLIIGRGWGQGPTHSQALQSWFAHIPGLKVVMPSNPDDAKGLLIESILDPNPVIFLEHRWLHNMEGKVTEGWHNVPIGKATVVSQGKDISLIASSLMVVEALHAASFLKKYYDISAEVVDLRSLRPLDWECIKGSVSKTKRVIALDIGHKTGSVSGEIIAGIAMHFGNQLKSKPQRIGLPDLATPTSVGATKNYYPDAVSICDAVAISLDLDIDTTRLIELRSEHHDIPGDWFKGPF